MNLNDFDSLIYKGSVVLKLPKCGVMVSITNINMRDYYSLDINYDYEETNTDEDVISDEIGTIIVNSLEELLNDVENKEKIKKYLTKGENNE